MRCVFLIIKNPLTWRVYLSLRNDNSLLREHKFVFDSEVNYLAWSSIGITLLAWQPFGPFSISYETCWPAFSVR